MYKWDFKKEEEKKQSNAHFQLRPNMNSWDAAEVEELSELEFTHYADSAGISTSWFQNDYNSNFYLSLQAMSILGLNLDTDTNTWSAEQIYYITDSGIALHPQ